MPSKEHIVGKTLKKSKKWSKSIEASLIGDVLKLKKDEFNRNRSFK